MWRERVISPFWSGRWAAGFVLAAVLVASPVTANAYCLGGDVDGSGEANVVDVQCEILATLYVQGGSEEHSMVSCLDGAIDVADVNCDAGINVVDVSLAVVFSLGATVNSTLDADSDQCPDNCQLDPTDPGVAEPLWQLEDFQPASADLGDEYGLWDIDGVTVVSLLLSS